MSAMSELMNTSANTDNSNTNNANTDNTNTSNTNNTATKQNRAVSIVGPSV